MFIIRHFFRTSGPLAHTSAVKNSPIFDTVNAIYTKSWSTPSQFLTTKVGGFSPQHHASKTPLLPAPQQTNREWQNVRLYIYIHIYIYKILYIYYKKQTFKKKQNEHAPKKSRENAAEIALLAQHINAQCIYSKLHCKTMDNAGLSNGSRYEGQTFLASRTNVHFL